MAGLVVGERVMKLRGEESGVLMELLWWVLVPGVVGARSYHVIDQWQYYQGDWNRIVAVWNGGLGIWGGIFGGAVGLMVFLWLRVKKMEKKVGEEFLILSDVLVLVSSLAQAIGRWGNYVNQELMSTWVYESILDLILFVILLVVYKREGVHGSTFGSYLVGYGIIRIILEPLRVESWVIGEVVIAQMVGLVSVVLGVLILIRKKRKVWF